MSIRKLNRRDLLKVAGVTTLLPASMLASRGSHAQSLSAFDYYIGPNGQDSNPGTREQPWAITALNTKRSMYAGKRVGLLDGIYNIYSLAYPSIPYYSSYLNVAGGTSSSPTVVEAVNPRQAILDGSSGGLYLNGGLEPGGGLIGGVGSDRSFITLRNLVVRNHFGTAILFGHTASNGHTVATKISGILVEGCEIHNTNGILGGALRGLNSSPLVFFHIANSTIRNCYIHDTYGETLTQKDHNSAILWWDVHDSVIEYCTFKKGPNPLHLKGAANARATIRFNYMEMDPTRTDVCIRSDEGQVGGATRIHNNVMVGITAISWSVSPYKTADTYIYNNTFVGTTQSGIAHHQADNATKLLRFYNNIIYRAPSSIPGGDLEFSADTWTVLNNNCYSPSGFKGRAYTPSNTSSSIEYASLASWRSRAQASLPGAESASLQTDPMFVGTGVDADAYKLRTGSPCRTSASDGGEVGAWGNGALRIGATLASSGQLSMPNPPGTFGVS